MNPKWQAVALDEELHCWACGVFLASSSIVLEDRISTIVTCSPECAEQQSGEDEAGENLVDMVCENGHQRETVQCAACGGAYCIGCLDDCPCRTGGYWSRETLQRNKIYGA